MKRTYSASFDSNTGRYVVNPKGGSLTKHQANAEAATKNDTLERTGKGKNISGESGSRCYYCGTWLGEGTPTVDSQGRLACPACGGK